MVNTTLQKLIDRLVDGISDMTAVEAIALNEAADIDVLDSYFALILDVYYRGELPDMQERLERYGKHEVFETSPSGDKDRFIVGDIPVRIEYKKTEKIEKNLHCVYEDLSELWQVKNSGTYGFYRLQNGKILYKKSDWIDRMIERVNNLPDSFWNKMRSYYQTTMEHFLMDFGAAIMRDDPFHYLVSSANFIKSLCGVLFIANHQFEPSHRAYNSRVVRLPLLPASFTAYFESFLRPDDEMPPERKYNLARQMAKGVVAL